MLRLGFALKAFKGCSVGAIWTEMAPEMTPEFFFCFFFFALFCKNLRFLFSTMKEVDIPR